MIRRLMVLVLLCLLLIGCSKDYYPWSRRNPPKWVNDSLKVDDLVLKELVEFGPVNKEKPILWCYKYKTVIVLYKLDNNGNIWKYTIWRDRNLNK